VTVVRHDEQWHEQFAVTLSPDTRLLSLSSCDFADLQDAHGFGELSGTQGQQRSLRRMSQVFSRALARSPGAAGRASARLACFFEACSFGLGTE
jgi:hypothetical protein